MRAPFYRTLEQIKEKGLSKTASKILVILLKRIRPHLKFLPEKCIVNVNNSKMLLLPRRGAIHEELFCYRKREPLCTDYLMRSYVLKKGDVVLDIGSNIGYYVLIESQLVGNKGKVYAVEPVQSNYELLKKNVNLNNVKNVSTFRFALGDKDEKSKIYISNSSNLCTMNRNAVVGKLLGVEDVYMETVDDFLEDKSPPNLIRMDVEGYEYQIIKGMAHTLKGNVKILVELHPWRPYLDSQKTNELLGILEQNNFKVQFAVFEDKVPEKGIVRVLQKKAGSKLPVIASNISIRELKKLIQDNYGEVGPNVVFEKKFTLEEDANKPMKAGFGKF